MREVLAIAQMCPIWRLESAKGSRSVVGLGLVICELVFSRLSSKECLKSP